MKVIVVNGSAGVGKDTFVDLCMKINLQSEKISTVDYVKEVANYCGWKGEKDKKARRFLSDLKDALSRWKDKPFQIISNQIKWFKENLDGFDKKGIVFIFSREPEELERFKQEFGATTVLITNENVTLVTGNHADADVRNFNYDFYIDNSGSLEDLKHSAESFMTAVEVYL